MNHQPRIYLAGPEVFLPNAKEVGAEKKKICRRYGFDGAFPLDKEADIGSLAPLAAGLRISALNEELMRRCDAVIANMTPFRGPSADVGTAYEMGFMRALDRPVLAYTNISDSYADRVQRRSGATKTTSTASEDLVDDMGMQIEQFDMVDNLMLEGAVRHSTAIVFAASVPEPELFTNLRAFEQCLAWAHDHREELFGEMRPARSISG